MAACGPDAGSWFGVGRWPECTCGFAPRNNRLLTLHWRDQGFSVQDDHGRLVTTPLWAVVGCDHRGLTFETTGPDPDVLADTVASWAQQEEDKWPEMGLIYMLISPEELPAAAAWEEER